MALFVVINMVFFYISESTFVGKHEETTLKKVGSQSVPNFKVHAYFFFTSDHTTVKPSRLPSLKKLKMVFWVTFKDLRQALHEQITQ